ncbi:hypothetical protein Tco_0627350 [Tanacetum coccineum]|uniref:Uncharacterized protein n=1 Tax=Tanacetum coccineum TaxID=301880 RepID=A0ABQ4WMC6_9ASTR
MKKTQQRYLLNKTEQGTKKRKSGHVKMIARKRPRPQPDDDSDDEYRKCIRIITFESTIDSEIMETKSFIARVHKVSSPYGNYLVVYRVNGHFRAFNYLMEVLHTFDRHDLFHLYDLVMKQYSEITPKYIELILWGDLKIMMESLTEENVQDDFWNNQQEWEIVRWRLYEACGVCIIEFKDGTDIKVPLILGRPFLSTTRAKIDIYKRKITLRVREERIVFTSVKPASSLIKRVYMLSLRERMELDLEARLMGETLVLNRSLDPFFKDYIELNDLNEPFELRRNQGDDLMPIIEEGEVIEEFRTKDDELDAEIDDYPSYCDYDKKIHIDYAHNLKFSCMIGIEFTHATFFPLFFAVLENMDAYRDKGIGDVIFGEPFLREVGIKTRRFEGMITIYNANDEVSDEGKNNGISHPYQKFKGFYKGVLNLGPDYIRDEKMEEWLTRGHISMHEME